MPNGHLAKKVDQDGDSYYIGWASPGTNTSIDGWKIQKIVMGPTDVEVTKLWADGNDRFDNVWDNRLSLNYS